MWLAGELQALCRADRRRVGSDHRRGEPEVRKMPRSLRLHRVEKCRPGGWVSENAFEKRRRSDPQGVIDDLLKQITRQAREIHDRGLEIERLKKELRAK